MERGSVPRRRCRLSLAEQLAAEQCGRRASRIWSRTEWRYDTTLGPVARCGCARQEQQLPPAAGYEGGRRERPHGRDGGRRDGGRRGGALGFALLHVAPTLSVHLFAGAGCHRASARTRSEIKPRHNQHVLPADDRRFSVSFFIVVPALVPAASDIYPLHAAYARLTQVFPLAGCDPRPAARGTSLPQGSELGARERSRGRWRVARRIPLLGRADPAGPATDSRHAQDVVTASDCTATPRPVLLLITVPWFLPTAGAAAPVETELRPSNVSLGRLAVRIEEFACLPDDPGRRRTVRARRTPTKVLRAEVYRRLSPPISPVWNRPRMRRGSRPVGVR